MQFRLSSLLWAFALLASAMATFGGGGIVVALIVVGLWTVYFSDKRSGPAGCLFAILIIVMLLALLAPAVQSAREAARRNSCLGHLKQLSLGLHNYESVNGSFPGAAQPDPNGIHPHSWRVRISPYLESQKFYSLYRTSEPWNSPNNSKAVNNWGPLTYFQCPSYDVQDGSTHYLAVVGDNTAFPPKSGRMISEITDGTSNTILLIEAPHKRVPWAKPQDMTFEEAVELLTNPPKQEDFGHEIDEGFFYKPSVGLNVAFCDGHVQHLRLPVPKKYAVAMLTANGGDVFDDWGMWQVRNPELDYGRIYGLCMFVLLSVAPAIKLRARKQAVPNEDAAANEE